VSTVLSHWDGFFNNYFTYHDRNSSGQWEIYPWDQDKTWGFHDQSGDKVFFPILDGLATRLRPEIPIRAQAIGESSDEALARLDRNLASLKEHLVKRREFLLKQEELLQRP
jgi:spore coat protein CotH